MIPKIVGKIGVKGEIEEMIKIVNYKKIPYKKYEEERVKIGVVGGILGELMKRFVILGEEGMTKKEMEEEVRHYLKKGIPERGELVIVFYDKKEKKLFLSTDKWGFREVFYVHKKEEIVFSSELKGVCMGSKEKEIEEIGLKEYFKFNYPLRERVFIKNVKKIPPNKVMEIDVKEIKVKIYSKKNSYFPTNDLGEILEKVIFSKINQSKTTYLTLTGGYDTRIILALLKDQPITCLTVGTFNSPDVIIAQKIAQKLNLPHFYYPLDSNFETILSSTIEEISWLSDGLVYLSNLPLFSCFKTFLPGNCLCFVGFGGSEVLRGNQNIGPQFSKEGYKIFFQKKENKKIEEEIIEDIRYYKERGITYFTINEVLRKYYFPIIKLLNLYGEVFAPYMAEEVVSFMYNNKLTHFSKNPIVRFNYHKRCTKLIQKYNPILAHIPLDRGYPPKWNLKKVMWGAVILKKLTKKNILQEIPGLKREVKKILEKLTIFTNLPEEMKKLKNILITYPNLGWKDWEFVLKSISFWLWYQRLLKEIK